MKLYGVPITNLNNEYLLKGKKSCVIEFKIFIVLTVVFAIAAIAFCFLGMVVTDILFVALFVGGVAVLTGVLAHLDRKGIRECDAEIEERLASGDITQQYIDKMLRPKTKEEKKEFIKKWGVYAVIIFVILFIVIGWSVSDDQSKNKYDDVFKKDPNTWSKDEKEYVDDLFNYIDSNN